MSVAVFNFRLLQLMMVSYCLWSPAPSFAEEVRFWLLQETALQPDRVCQNEAGCKTERAYVVHAVPFGAEDAVKPLLERLTTEGGKTGTSPEAPQICGPITGEVGLGFNPETVPPAHKLAALSGVDAIGLDLNKIKVPPGARNDFGTALQGVFVDRLSAAGITVVTPERANELPGRPTLNIYVSYSDLQGDCNYTYSIFASLTQTALLTRDLRTKVVVGVWSLSVKGAPGAGRGTEFDALAGVADRFVADFRKANTR